MLISVIEIITSLFQYLLSHIFRNTEVSLLILHSAD